MFADHFAVIHSFEIEAIALLNVDVEMIAPELDHEFIELALAVDLSDECCLTQFIRDRLAVVIIEELVADGFQFISIHVQ